MHNFFLKQLLTFLWLIAIFSPFLLFLALYLLFKTIFYITLSTGIIILLGLSPTTVSFFKPKKKKKSKLYSVSNGVPQGSVLGHSYFSLMCFQNKCRKFIIRLQSFADDICSTLSSKFSNLAWTIVALLLLAFLHFNLSIKQLSIICQPTNSAHCPQAAPLAKALNSALNSRYRFSPFNSLTPSFSDIFLNHYLTLCTLSLSICLFFHCGVHNHESIRTKCISPLKWVHLIAIFTLNPA